MRGRLVSPTYLNMLLVLAIGVHFILPVRRLIYPPYTYSGFVFILLGVGINIWAVRAFKKLNTTIDFHGIPNKLITFGPFRFSRNPIYLSGVILSFGIAVLLGSLIILVFSTALLLILDRLYIPSEEFELENEFGERYLKYKKRVRRWL